MSKWVKNNWSLDNLVYGLNDVKEDVQEINFDNIKKINRYPEIKNDFPSFIA